MEGSESEAIFDSLNLNPQLFINATLNIVDELIDSAFEHLHRLVFILILVTISINYTYIDWFSYSEASAQLKIEGSERAEDLTKVY